jgi:hypothetical protein
MAAEDPDADAVFLGDDDAGEVVADLGDDGPGECETEALASCRRARFFGGSSDGRPSSA